MIIDNDNHPIDQGLDAEPNHWGTQMAEATVTPLNPINSPADSKAWAGQILNQTRKGSDRTNVVPISSRIKIK